MGTMLQLPAFPRHGILLNPSPSTSPYGHPASLPGTPHLISSYSSLSSSASSTSPHHYEADHYFLCASPRDASAIPRNGSLTPTTHPAAAAYASKRASTGCVPQPRKIRFAPLPEPRRDELPDVFLDDSTENLNTLPLTSPDTPRASTSSTPPRPGSLLFSGPIEPQSTTDSVVVPPPAASSSGWSHITSSNNTTPVAVAPSSQTSSSDRYDSDTDLPTPQSPAMALLSSSCSFVDRYPCPQSCPESPIGRRPDLPCSKDGKERRWSTKKLFKLPLGSLAKKEISITTEDVLTLGVNQLFRSSTRDGDDASSGGATPLRNRSRERSESECEFGAPLARSTSDQTGGGKKKPRKSSFLSSLTGGSSSNQQDNGLWRTQSATTDLRRSKSRESQLAALENVKRPRSSSTSVSAANPRPRRQLKMLNGRVYGAKRSNLNGVNLFASARSEDPEFVEWGYGGMGSVKSASVGDTRYTRVQGSAALGSASDNTSWSNRRGSTGAPSHDDDDGSGMAWLKKRREQREKERKEKEEKESAERPAEEQHASAAAEGPVQEQETTSLAVVAEETPEHVTKAITLPAPHAHHSRPSVERVPSFALRHSMERKGSADTARQEHYTSAAAVSSPGLEVEAVGEMDISGEQDVVVSTPSEGTPRERRESESSANSDSGSDEDADADAEDSVRSEDDEDDAEEEERIRRTAVGAGVEKISRHNK